jgi:hypothetical protein
MPRKQQMPSKAGEKMTAVAGLTIDELEQT